MTTDQFDSLKRTPLHALHEELGGKMVPFAGYSMPVQYSAGIVQEHLHTRAAATLFDVSHMGQVRVDGGDFVAAFETLVPGDLEALTLGRMRYTFFTNDAAGILDDLMVTRFEDHLFVVVNAACKDADLRHMEAGLGGRATVSPLEDCALLALQGPKAVDVMARLVGDDIRAMPFLSMAQMNIDGIPVLVSRSGYTGEDGFEMSIAANEAERLARQLLDQDEVEPAGLGARDSLRLEAGLCLYGNDLDERTTPVEAGLAWSISKRRREGGGFPGAEVVQRQLREGVKRKRVGIRPEGRVIAREHVEIVNAAGARVGEITSGGFGPTVGGPVAMGYVESDQAQVGLDLGIVVRGRQHPAKVAKMPFVELGYYRGN